MLPAYCPQRNAGDFSTSKCFAICELIKFMCLGSVLSSQYLLKEFLNPRLHRTHSSAGSRPRPANAGTCNPCGLTRPAQDSNTHTYAAAKSAIEAECNHVK